ncbi:unnamed protein product, partial [Rotaria sp. Silwood2]
SPLPIIESIRCSKKCTFHDISLNSSFPSEFCPTSKLNDDIDQQCLVELAIDLTASLVSGSFNVENRTVLTKNKVQIESTFSLGDISVKVNIQYDCSVSDYCDLEFVHEILSSNWSAIQVQPLRKKLSSHLYNPNNTDPIQCLSRNQSCPQNTS